MRFKRVFANIGEGHINYAPVPLNSQINDFTAFGGV